MRYVRSTTLLLSVLAGLAVLHAAAQSAEKPWVSLFNGKDLSGWKNYGEEKWTVDGGEILGEAVTKAYGYLGTEKTFKSFEMKGKFKAEGSGNSGIFYHSTINGTDITGVPGGSGPAPQHAYGRTVRNGRPAVARVAEPRR